MTEALIDNDVLYKAAMFGIAQQLLDSAPFEANRFHMLGAAKFMISKKLAKRPPKRGAEAVLAEFGSAIAAIGQLEPTEEEQRIAGELEYLAGKMNLELDAGESLLCAILIIRSSDYIFTGDKRAIAAIAKLLAQRSYAALSGKIVCLEQIFQWLINTSDSDKLRAAVCADFSVDKAISNCFACNSPNSAPADWLQGLASYIGHLHATAPNVLAVDPAQTEA